MKGGLHFYRGSGAGAARYFDEGHRTLEVRGPEAHRAQAQGAEAYYREHGRAAVEIDSWTAGERSGTTVLAESGDLVQWVEGIELTTGKVKGDIRSGGKDRQPLRFVEMVVNNPKSLSIVASQNPVVAAAYDALLARQADEIAKYLSVVAVTRIGSRGAQREVGGLVVETARVLHLTSREADPHRHVHLMLNARVRTGDGIWRALHSAAIRQHIAALNARGSRVLVTDAELRAVLAAEGYSLGIDGEIDQAREAVELLSKRSAQVAANRDRIEVAWRREHPDEEPSQRVKNAWDHQAWAEGRRAKPKERETTDELSERVRVELADAGFDFTPGAHPPIDCGPVEPSSAVVSIGEVDRDEIARHAVAVLSAHNSAWGRAELTAAVEEAVTSTGVVGEIQAVSELVQECEAGALACCSSVLDLTAQAPTAMSRHLTSPAVLDADTALNLGLAGLAGRESSRDDKGIRIALVEGLDEGQAKAVGALCGTARLEVVLGPAGTGKTAMLAVAKERLEHQGRKMVLVAPTRKAAEVAGAEVGVTASSLSKLLYDNGWRWDELGRFARLSPGALDPVTGRIHHGPGEGSVLSGSSVVVVDEAGLTTVDQANALIDLVAGSGAALRLVGDPRQLGAVGRGGVMETASRWCGDPVTLDQVHRFLRVEMDEAGRAVTETDAGYAQLSLALRDGSSPDEVVDQLIERGAVTVHPTRAVAVAAIAAEIADEMDSDGAAKDPTTRGRAAKNGALAVTVATNDDAGALNESVRELRVRAGLVEDNRVALGMAGVRIGAGDRIVTRRNDTARDVANREAWTVEAVTADGAVLARSVGGPRCHQVLLEASYVAEAVQLGYASTDYGNQGVTTDRSLTWVTNATSAGGLYVGATRGRYANALHVVAEDPEDARTQLVSAVGRDRADRGLDTARALAEMEAVLVATTVLVTGAERSAVGTERPVPARTFDPADWRSAAELDAKARAIEARLDRGLRALREVPVMANDVREELNRADRRAAEAAREKAAWHRAEADRVAVGRDELVASATADHFAAREDSRIIEAGPGRFHHRAAKLEAARARRDEAARRWPQFHLPGSRWTDAAVHDAASRAAGQIVTPAVQHHHAEAERAESTAAGRNARAVTRDLQHEAAITTNDRRSTRREALIANADRNRAAVARSRERRDELIETMTLEEVAAADEGRDVLVEDQARELHLARQPGYGLGGHEQLRTPTIKASGPGIEA